MIKIKIKIIVEQLFILNDDKSRLHNKITARRYCLLDTTQALCIICTDPSFMFSTNRYCIIVLQKYYTHLGFTLQPLASIYTRILKLKYHNTILLLFENGSIKLMGTWKFKHLKKKNVIPTIIFNTKKF